MALPEPSYLKIGRAIFRAKFWIVLIAILSGAYFSGTFDFKSSNESVIVKTHPSGTQKTTLEGGGYRSNDEELKTQFNHPAIQIQEGIDKIFTKKPLIAPLVVKTAVGLDKYYVKLVDERTGEAVMTFFVYGGQSFEAKVPLGVYRLKYAAGKTWYGEEYKFGPDTTYSQAEQTFEFYRQGDQVSGYTIELILQRTGNLKTRKILATEF